MTRRAVLALAVLLLFALAACGDDDDQGRVEDPTSIEATIGPATTLPRGLKSVNPEHAAQVSAASLQTGGTAGICLALDLLAGEGIPTPEDTTILTLNVEDVSQSMAWITTDDDPTSEAVGCYTPPEALKSDTYAATVRYLDATGRTFIYNWQFEVIE